MDHSRPQRQIHSSLFCEAFDFTISRKPVASFRPKATIPEDDGVSRMSSHEGSLGGPPSEVSPIEPASFEESCPEPQTIRSFQAPESPTVHEDPRQKNFLQPYQAIPVDSSSLLYSNPPPSRRVLSKIFSQRHNHGWTWELSSCLLSFLSLIAIIIILKHYDGQQIQDAPQSVTLNSMLAIFTTLAKVGLMVPLAEALSQLKWVWFREAERPLMDFQTFDEASRGPLGGLRLLGMLKGRHLPSVGAAISILALAVSPITQQLVSYPTRTVSTGNLGSDDTAYAPRSDFFMGYVPMSGSDGVPDLPIKQAVQNGIYNPVNETIQDVGPTCSTGNCNWPSFSSLAVCAEVANVSDKLSSGKISPSPPAPTDHNMTLPNGASLEAGQYVMNITSLPSIVHGWQSSQANATLAFGNETGIFDTAISNFFVIYRKDINIATMDDFGAMEVLLRWCVNTYDTKVVDGEAVTNVTSNATDVVTNNGTIPFSKNMTQINGTSDFDNFMETGNLVMRPMTGDTRNNFTVEVKANIALEVYLHSVFRGTYTYGRNFGESYSTDAAMMLSSALFDQPSQANVSGQAAEDMQLQGVKIAAQNVATSMTNNIRQRKYWGEPAKGIPSQVQNGQLKTFVKVRWGWLAFLIILLVSSFGFLVATIVKSQRAKVDALRSSALAALCGLSPESKEYMGSIALRGQTREKAEGLKVRLNRRPNGWNLETKL